MKYLLISLVLLCGCDCGTVQEPQKHYSGYPGYNLSTFELKNHQYIKFGENNCQTIVHDPDCHCLKAEKNVNP